MGTNIFRLGLTDKRIMEMSKEDLETLILEAEDWVSRKELEISMAIAPHGPIILEDGTYATMEPSLYSFEEVIWEAELEADPAFREGLAKAREIQQQIGVAVGIESTAELALSAIQAKDIPGGTQR